MQEIIEDIYRQYPWASEQTAEAVSKAMSNSPENRKKIAIALTSAMNPAALTELERLLDKADAINEKELKAQTDLTSSFRGASKAVMSQNVDGLGAMTSLFEELAQAAGELGVGDAIGGAFGSLRNSRNKLIRGIGLIGQGGTEIASSTLGMAAGVGTFVAAFTNSQDKLLKTMIDVGLADANMGALTDLRSGAASLGMGFDEYAKVLQVSSNLIGAGHDSALQGATIFTNMANYISRNDEINKFGYRTSELTMRLATTADALYKSNQISTLDSKAQEKIINLFTVTNEIALGLASTTGENRMKLLDELQAQREDIDLNTSFQIAQQKYIDENGQEAFDNLRNSTQMYLANIAQRFGKDSPIYAEIEKTFKGAVYDINFDQNIINNMTPELVQLLNEIGGGALQQFISQGQNILAGNTTQEQTVVDVSRLLGIFSDQFDNGIRRFASVDPITNAAVNAMSAAKVANDAVKDVSMTDLQTMMQEAADSVSVADGSIRAIDDAAIAMTTTLEAIIPGIDTMDDTLDLAYGAMDFTQSMVNALGAMLGLDVNEGARKIADIRKQIEEARVTDVVLYKQGSKEYNRSNELMRISPTGDITALSFKNYQHMTRDFLSNRGIQNASQDTLNSRVNTLTQMREAVNTSLQNKDEVRSENGTLISKGLSQEQIALYNQQLRILDSQLSKLHAQIVEEDSVLEGPN